MCCEVCVIVNWLVNFDDANLRRSARAAVAAGARVERALELLGDDIPDHLREAGELRIMHKQASLEELGQLHDPVLTKDAIAGRIPGGLGIVACVTSAVFGAISGAAASSVIAIGTIMIPEMEKHGYDRGYSAALISSGKRGCRFVWLSV